MSLRNFHLFFIVISGLLSLFMIFWGIYDFRSTGAWLGLGFCLLGALSAVLLTVYFRWFRQKYSKLTPLAVFSGLMSGFLFSDARWASACAVCYKDPESPLTKGAMMGVLVLAVIVCGVLAGIAYIGYSWHKRAKFLSTHL
ncbi:MAG TPA: hypothetical protein DF383_13550 [Deltaproteobacteria bacterium]|nr:hypothetical protein [Deltaproteobacteria bacterium]